MKKLTTILVFCLLASIGYGQGDLLNNAQVFGYMEWHVPMSAANGDSILAYNSADGKIYKIPNTGGGGGGDVYLANTQTFTGASNTFNNELRALDLIAWSNTTTAPMLTFRYKNSGDATMKRYLLTDDTNLDNEPFWSETGVHSDAEAFYGEWNLEVDKIVYNNINNTIDGTTNVPLVLRKSGTPGVALGFNTAVSNVASGSSYLGSFYIGDGADPETFTQRLSFGLNPIIRNNPILLTEDDVDTTRIAFLDKTQTFTGVNTFDNNSTFKDTITYIPNTNANAGAILQVGADSIIDVVQPIEIGDLLAPHFKNAGIVTTTTAATHDFVSSTVVGSKTISADTLSVGDYITIELFGGYSSSGTSSNQFFLVFGNDTIMSSAAENVGNTSSEEWAVSAQWHLQVTATGTSGVIQGNGSTLIYKDIATGVLGRPMTAFNSGAFDSTVDNEVKVLYATSGTPTIKIYQLTMEIH